MDRIADPARAAQLMTDFLKASDGTWTGGYFSYNGTTTDAQLTASAQIVEQIIWAILPNWEFEEASQFDRPWDSHRNGAVRALAQLVKQDELEEILGTSAPKLDASTLHPWVWQSAQTAWSAGGYADAVRAAARAVNTATRQKLKRKNLSEWKLIQNAFSTKPPAAGEPRLRLMKHEDSDTFESLHSGLGALARGLYQAVRNPANHDDDETEIEEGIALEELAAFSVLARHIDTAWVERIE